MKRQILLILLGLLLFQGCKKEEETPVPDCEKYQSGTLKVHNTSSDTYKILVNGIFEVTVTGYSWSSELWIPEGNNVELYAEQVSGYILYPTIRETTFNVVRCSDYTWDIP